MSRLFDPLIVTTAVITGNLVYCFFSSTLSTASHQPNAGQRASGSGIAVPDSHRPGTGGETGAHSTIELESSQSPQAPSSQSSQHPLYTGNSDFSTLDVDHSDDTNARSDCGRPGHGCSSSSSVIDGSDTIGASSEDGSSPSITEPGLDPDPAPSTPLHFFSSGVKPRAPESELPIQTQPHAAATVSGLPIGATINKIISAVTGHVHASLQKFPILIVT
jgi:hypothetical protein